MLYIPNAKRDKLTSSIHNLLSLHASHSITSVRDLASIAGQFISMTPAISPIARLMTRECYSTINERQSWASSILLTSCVITELDFWILNIHSLNGFPFKFLLVPHIQISSDASARGNVRIHPQLRQNAISWPLDRNQQLNMARTSELAAVLRVLKESKSFLANHKVKCLTDNLRPTHCKLRER